MRAYTVSEIDALRRVVENKWLFGNYNWLSTTRSSRSYRETDKAACVEEMVRTHMLAGHTAEDLLASEPTVETPRGLVLAKSA